MTEKNCTCCKMSKPDIEYRPGRKECKQCETDKKKKRINLRKVCVLCNISKSQKHFIKDSKVCTPCCENDFYSLVNFLKSVHEQYNEQDNLNNEQDCVILYSE